MSWGSKSLECNIRGTGSVVVHCVERGPSGIATNIYSTRCTPEGKPATETVYLDKGMAFADALGAIAAYASRSLAKNRPESRLTDFEFRLLVDDLTPNAPRVGDVVRLLNPTDNLEAGDYGVVANIAPHKPDYPYGIDWIKGNRTTRLYVGRDDFEIITTRPGVTLPS